MAAHHPPTTLHLAAIGLASFRTDGPILQVENRLVDYKCVIDVLIHSVDSPTIAEWAIGA